MKEKCKMRLTGVSGVHIWRFTDAVLPAFTGFFAASVANIDGHCSPGRKEGVGWLSAKNCLVVL